MAKFGSYLPLATMGGVQQALVGQELSEFLALFSVLGEPSYRARQAYHALYRRRCREIEDIASFPRSLRRRLAADYAAGLPDVAGRYDSADGAVRYLLRLADSKTVEAVFIPEARRDTLCISTQVGCPIDCKFCLTALMGLERNLSAGEIVGQVLALSREHGLEPRERPLNIVMMGMGEPLLNLDAVAKATRLLTDSDGVAIPARRITVSTSGLVPQIKAFAKLDPRPELAVSLNAADEETRRRIMPITAKYPLAELIEACREYPLGARERMTFEYVLLGGVNDSEADARALVRLLNGIRARVNLIALNPGPGIDFETPAPERVGAFQEIVRRSQPCFLRRPRGLDVYAACGQLKRTADC